MSHQHIQTQSNYIDAIINWPAIVRSIGYSKKCDWTRMKFGCSHHLEITLLE